MDRYIGLDAHSASCTAAVVGPSGKRLKSQVLETNGKALVEFVRSVPGTKHLCFEEGNHAAWLHELLSPHVEEIVVAHVRSSRGPKSDRRDAFGLAEMLRIGAVKTRVYKGQGEFALLGELARAYTVVVTDSTRVQRRLKALFRSRGIPTDGKGVYAPSERASYLARLPERSRPRAETLYLELDALLEVRKKAQREMVAEARRHGVFRTLKTCPGMGDIRVAQMLPIVVTPYRFASKRSFWAYIGLAVVTRSSSDWVRAKDGQWLRAQTLQTRGLNRNYNHKLKDVFKGAATTVVQRAKDGPLYRHYQSLLDGGTKPNLAKLTIARQIASITLSMWRSGEEYEPRKLEQSK
jgi:transposase